MEKNYYFVIGQKNIMVAEAIKILQKSNLPFKCLKEPYLFTKDEEDALVQQGYEPYYVNVAFRSAHNVYYQISDSFLYKLYQWNSDKKAISDKHYDAMMFCLGTVSWNWATNLQNLVRLCQNKAYIQQLQAENRLALGIDKQAEQTAEQAVHETLKNATKPYDCLVVRWNYPAQNCDIETFLPILDRVFWVQHFVNVLVVTQKNVFYYGYQKMAMEVFQKFGISGFFDGYACGAMYPLDEEKIESVGNFFAEKTADLRKNGLLW